MIWQEDKKHKGWTVHLHVGGEVIKYSHPDGARDAGDGELAALAVEDAREDGYELDPASVSVKR